MDFDLNELSPEEIVELGYILNDEMEKEASEYYEDEEDDFDLNELSPEEIVELGYLLNEEMEKEASEYYDDEEYEDEDYLDLNELSVDDFIEVAAELEQDMMEKEAFVYGSYRMGRKGAAYAKRKAGQFGRYAKKKGKQAKQYGKRQASRVGPAMESAGAKASARGRKAAAGAKRRTRAGYASYDQYTRPTMMNRVSESYKGRMSRAGAAANQMAGRSRRGGKRGMFGFTQQNAPSRGQKAMAYGREFSPEITAGGAAVTLGGLMAARRGE